MAKNAEAELKVLLGDRLSAVLYPHETIADRVRGLYRSICALFEKTKDPFLNLDPFAQPVLTEQLLAESRQDDVAYVQKGFVPARALRLIADALPKTEFRDKEATEQAMRQLVCFLGYKHPKKKKI